MRAALNSITIATDQRLALIKQASVARSHALVLYKRVAQMLECIELGHLGTAKSIAELTRMDYEALISSLPNLNAPLVPVTPLARETDL